MKKLLLVLSLVLGLSNVSLHAKNHTDHNYPTTEFTLEELAKYNGQNGNKAYVAVDGVVYDVTGNKYWKGGAHTPTEGRLKAGVDGTKAIMNSPHGKAVLKELKVVGKLKQ